MIKGMLCDHRTGKVDIGRALCAASVLSAILFEGVAIIVKNQNFDAMSFCSGLGALLAGGGFGVAINNRGPINNVIPTEPEQG